MCLLQSGFWVFCCSSVLLFVWKQLMLWIDGLDKHTGDFLSRYRFLLWTFLCCVLFSSLYFFACMSPSEKARRVSDVWLTIVCSWCNNAAARLTVFYSHFLLFSYYLRLLWFHDSLATFVLHKLLSWLFLGQIKVTDGWVYRIGRCCINRDHNKPTVEVKVKENILIFTDIIEYSHSFTFHKAKEE